MNDAFRASYSQVIRCRKQQASSIAAGVTASGEAADSVDLLETSCFACEVTSGSTTLHFCL